MSGKSVSFASPTHFLYELRLFDSRPYAGWRFVSLSFAGLSHLIAVIETCLLYGINLDKRRNSEKAQNQFLTHRSDPAFFTRDGVAVSVVVTLLLVLIATYFSL